MSHTPPPHLAHHLGLTWRILAAIFGSWALAWGLVACGTATLVAAGAEFHDAEMTMQILGLLACLGLFLWSFAARNLWLVSGLLAGGTALLNAAALWMQRTTLP